jgi:type II secretory pathway component PulK
MKQRRTIANSEQGAALIAALLIIGIVAGIAIDLMYRSQVEIQQTKLMASAEQVELDTSYAIAFAELSYIDYFAPDLQKNSNYKPPRLPIVMESQKLDNTTVNSRLNSAQGLFNINNLSDPAYIPLFSQLIQEVDPDLKTGNTLEIAYSIAYFINSKVDPALEKNYMTAAAPYRPAHRFLTSPSELRLVDQVTLNLYEKLMPYVIALPKKTSLNPSVAPRPVLKAYGLSNEAANAVIGEQVLQGAFKSLEDFYTMAKFKPSNTSSTLPLFDLKNQYFLLTTEMKNEVLDWTIYTLLEADKLGQKLNLLQETRNTL